MRTIVVRCVHGLEWVCADEVCSRLPLARDVRLARREVTLELPSVDSGLLELRTVDDVFVTVGRLDDVGPTRAVLPGLGPRLAELPLDTMADELVATRAVPRRPRVDVVASVEGRRTYSRFDVENAVGPLVAARLRGSYLPRTGEGPAPGEADLSVRLFLRGTTATAAIRVASRPLHRRPYKQDTGPGTLHPPVAAALVRLAATPADGILLDPFCGDGTIAIESALSLAATRVVGSDIDAGRLANAARNAHRAGVRPALIRADAAHPPLRDGAVAAVVTNPPWNLAVDAAGGLGSSLDEFWVRMGGPLAADGRVCAIVDEGLDAPATLRRLGRPVALATRIRLAGRVSHLVLCGAPSALDGGLVRWRERAIAEGVVTESGF